MQYNFDKIIPRENTDCYKYDKRKSVFGTEEVQPMWLADMDFATPDFITDSLICRAKHPVYGYTFRSGNFNQAVAGWMQKRFGWNIDNNWISFSPGIVPAINLCVQCFSKPGDGIIIQSPVYAPFFSAIKAHGRKILNNQLIEKQHKYYIDFNDFEKKARNAVLFIFCHPHNPVGRVWTEAELNQLVSICRENNVLIVSDEIHHDLVLNGNKHIPLAQLNGDAAAISLCCVSPGKTFNLAGLSTSAIIIPDSNNRKKYEHTMDKFHMGMGNIFGFIALEAAYSKGEEWLDQLLRYLEKNLEFLLDFINRRIPEISVVVPEATYLVWMDFRKLEMDNISLQKFLVQEAGIGLNNGSAFGPGGEGFQRMNIAVPFKKLEEAMLKLENAIKKNRK